MSSAPPSQVFRARLSPTLLLSLLLVAYLALVLFQFRLNPLALAEMSQGFVDGQPTGTIGYDGQFSYWLAIDPSPAAAGAHFDVPAYRYQRILYPLLARLLAFGQPALIPWTLILVNLVAQIGGTLAVEVYLAARGISRWYALTYGLWVGVVAAVRLDLNEPLAYALVAAGLLAQQRGRLGWTAFCLGLALLAKETALAFLIALMVWAAVARNARALVILAASAIPFAIYQIWLLRSFGVLGLASGGYAATPFEWIPYMGLWRIAQVSPLALLLLGSIMVPLAVFPSAWGVVAAAWRLWRRDWAPEVLTLGANAALIVVLPFSTFREPLSVVRLETGLVLATVLFGAHVRSSRVLNYSLFWIAALAFLVRGSP